MYVIETPHRARRVACGHDAVVDLACVVAGFFDASNLYDIMLTSVLYWQRHRLWGLLPECTRARLLSWRRQYVPLEVFDWHSATRAGLSSTLFDIETNIRDGDARAGLDEAGMQQLHHIMQQQGIVRFTHLCRSPLMRRASSDTASYYSKTALTPKQAYHWMLRLSHVCRSCYGENIISRGGDPRQDRL